MPYSLSSHRPALAELDLVTRWLWLTWRVLLFCSLLGSPTPLVVPGALLRLGHALRSLRRAMPSIESQRAETPYPFDPDDGLLLRPDYQAKHGLHGHHLVEQLGGPPPRPRGTQQPIADGAAADGYPGTRPHATTPDVDDSPKEYLSPPPAAVGMYGGTA